MDTKTARVRALNDELRQHLTGGMVVITVGVAALGPAAVALIVKTIAVFDDFCHANDPHEEHDFGSFEADGTMIYSISKSITTTKIYRCIRPTPPIALSRSTTPAPHAPATALALTPHLAAWCKILWTARPRAGQG